MPGPGGSPEQGFKLPPVSPSRRREKQRHDKVEAMAKIAFLGLGAMGSRMATSLLKAGHTLTVWNRDDSRTHPLTAAGARKAATPYEAAKGCEFVIAMLRDVPASRSVWLDAGTGALEGMAPDAIAIDSSTVTVAWAKELARTVTTKGMRFLEAPVVGSRPQADAGQLIYLAGGEHSTFAEAEPVLKQMAGTVHHTGLAGSAAMVKLSVNPLYAIQIAALGELLGLISREGFDTARCAEVLTSTPSASPAVKLAAGAMLARNFAPLFPIELVEKDLGYTVETATAHGPNHPPVHLPLVAAAQAIFQQAVQAGHGEDNITGVAQLYL